VSKDCAAGLFVRPAHALQEKNAKFFKQILKRYLKTKFHKICSFGFLPCGTFVVTKPEKDANTGFVFVHRKRIRALLKKKFIYSSTLGMIDKTLFGTRDIC
jgi:hypothetical protein